MSIRNLVLIGPRAAGKSKTARRVHKYLGFQHLSTDVLICYEEGMSISDIVKKKGWAYFRDVEYRVLEKVSLLNGYVVDCGGGIVVDLDEQQKEIRSDRKMVLLKNLGYVVQLNADFDYIYDKVNNDKTRPPLADREGFKKLMHQRQQYFSELTDVVLNTTRKRGRQISKELLPFLEDAGFRLLRKPGEEAQ